MWLKRFFEFDRKAAKGGDAGESVNEGIYYLYLILGLQVIFIFSLLAVIMFVGRVLATPAWVFVFVLLLGVAGLVYVYRKAREQFRRFKENLRKVDLSNRNYEISFMGGMLTMRVEHHDRPLLAAPAPPSDPNGTVLDAEPLDAIPVETEAPDSEPVDAETVETTPPHGQQQAARAS